MLFRGRRGASTVEYGLILIGVILLAAGGFKLLGKSVGTRSGQAGNEVAGQSAGGGGGGQTTPAGGANAKGGAAGGGDGKMSATSKMTVGGAGGQAGQGGGGGGASTQSGLGSNRDTESSPGTGPISMTADRGGSDVSESFGAKRWFGIGLLAAGVAAIVYVLFSMKRTKKAADAAGPGNGPEAKNKRPA